MTKVYRVYCNGFHKRFLTLPEVQSYIDWLRTQGCVGHEVEMAVGQGSLTSTVFEPGYPRRREILKAA